MQEKKSKKYVEGVSCPKCHDFLTEFQKSRFAMRQKQIIQAKKLEKKYIFQKNFAEVKLQQNLNLTSTPILKLTKTNCYSIYDRKFVSNFI